MSDSTSKIEPIEVIGNIKFYNADSILLLKQLENDEFDVVLSDPPYGIGMSKSAGKSKKTKDKKWDDNAMPQSFFAEQKRVSKEQIIWGANHFVDNLPRPRSSSCWLLWDKREGFIPERTYADAEIAWTSFTSPIRIFRFYWDGFLMRQKEVRIHPTQKPVSLGEWCLTKFCAEAKNILIPFGGSFSEAIACYNLGLSATVCEMDPEIFALGLERFKNHIAQETIWRQIKEVESGGEQKKLF